MRFTAIIGHPLEHTLSPMLHQYIYDRVAIKARMLVLADANLGNLIKQIREKPIELTAVTIPHKQAIMKYLDEVEERAKEIGAVNTVINRNGQLCGYNTDVVGIERALSGVEIKNRTVLLLGAGGAAQPAARLVNQKGGKLICCNRSKDKAEKLVKKFGGQVVELDELNPEDADVIINATPIGMYPKVDEMPLDASLLGNHQTVFDMIYNPRETKLLREAKIKGAKIISGLEMFIEQGLEQIRLWSGREYDDEGLSEILKTHLSG
ncbi:MAG: shikimate dehydrogenase [Patescibacteria group bacterium]